MSEDLELESFWADLTGSTIRLASDKFCMDDLLEEARLKASFDLSSMYMDKELDKKDIPEIVSRGIRLFISHWYEKLRSQDLAGLVEFMMEGLQIPPLELSQFMRTMPKSLVNRVVDSITGSASGMHALYVLEWHRRSGSLEDYRLSNDSGRIRVSFQNPKGPVSFMLDERFDAEVK